MIKVFDDFLDQISKWGIVFCVFFMLLFTLANIVLRWFEVSIHWFEPLVRHLVFMAAFLGGSLATGNRHHIKIDVLARILEKSKNNKLTARFDKVVTSITLVATIILAKASIDLSKIEFEFGKEVFLNIHSGYLISIIPFGMILISLRLLLRLIISFQSESKSEKES